MLLFTIRLNAQNTTIKKTFHLLLQYDFFPLNALQMRPLSFLYQVHWPSHLLQQFLTVIKVPGCSSIMWNSRSPRGHHPPWRESTNSFLDLELLNPKDILWERKKKKHDRKVKKVPPHNLLSRCPLPLMSLTCLNQRVCLSFPWIPWPAPSIL